LAKKKKFKAKKQNREIDEIEEQRKKENSPYSRFIGEYGRSQRKERTPEEKKEYRKLALFLVAWTILLASFYVMGIQIEQLYWNNQPFIPDTVIPVTSLIYLILGAVFFFIWLIFNGGFKKIDVTKFEKPDDMGYDEFCKFIDKLKERQRKSKYFLILFLPFIIILLMDYLIMVWGVKLSK